MSGIKLQTFGLLARSLDGKPTTPGASNLTWQRATTLAEGQSAGRKCNIQNELSTSLSKLRRKFCNTHILFTNVAAGRVIQPDGSQIETHKTRNLGCFVSYNNIIWDNDYL